MTSAFQVSLLYLLDEAGVVILGRLLSDRRIVGKMTSKRRRQSRLI
jgi:hypothetical protein